MSKVSKKSAQEIIEVLNNETTQQVETTTEKAKVIRKTKDEKTNELRQALITKFNVDETNLNNFVLRKLASSKKKTTLEDFFKKLILDLVLNKIEVEKIK